MGCLKIKEDKRRGSRFAPLPCKEIVLILKKQWFVLQCWAVHRIMFSGCSPDIFACRQVICQAPQAVWYIHRYESSWISVHSTHRMDVIFWYFSSCAAPKGGSRRRRWHFNLHAFIVPCSGLVHPLGQLEQLLSSLARRFTCSLDSTSPRPLSQIGKERGGHSRSAEEIRVHR